MHIFYLTAFVVLVLDQIIKLYVQAQFSLFESRHIIPGIFSLTYVLNPGAAFGILRYQTGILIVLTLGVILAVILYRKEIPFQPRMLRWGLALGLGGALGNLADRLRLGGVVDYMDFHVWPVFNLADMAIVTGVGLIIFASIRTELQEKRKRGMD